jgi:hypothetical protein
MRCVLGGRPEWTMLPSVRSKTAPRSKQAASRACCRFVKAGKRSESLIIYNNKKKKLRRPHMASLIVISRDLSSRLASPCFGRAPLLPRARMVWLGGCCLGLIMMLASKQVCFFFYCFLAVSYFDVVVQYLQQPACGVVWSGRTVSCCRRDRGSHVATSNAIWFTSLRAENGPAGSPVQ